MKKATLTFIISITIILQSFGQLNPINNLDWYHLYVCPNNYFSLSWEAPNTSQDTLMGYNVYRDDELYRFQTEYSLYHLDWGENCGMDFIAYQGGSFWIHVTAVYNSTYLESNYNDSTYCGGVLIGVEQPESYQLTLFPNPTTGNFNIDINDHIKSILLISQTGEVLKEIEPNAIDISNYGSGIYYIKVIAEHRVFVEKIVLL